MQVSSSSEEGGEVNEILCNRWKNEKEEDESNYVGENFMMTRDHHAIQNLIIHTHECQIYLHFINAQEYFSLISILYAVEFPAS